MVHSEVLESNNRDTENEETKKLWIRARKEDKNDN